MAGWFAARLLGQASTGTAGSTALAITADGRTLEIPRRGVFALWGKGPGNPVPGTARVELVFPGGTYGIRKRMVSAELIPAATRSAGVRRDSPPVDLGGSRLQQFVGPEAR